MIDILYFQLEKNEISINFKNTFLNLYFKGQKTHLISYPTLFFPRGLIKTKNALDIIRLLYNSNKGRKGLFPTSNIS